MTLLEVKDLKTYYTTLGGVVKAVDKISFEVEKGEVLGLAGESGCGKTTAGLSILRLLPSAGRIVGGQILLEGRNLVTMEEDEYRKLRWKAISMIFQGAMNALNPVHRIENQIAEAIGVHEDSSKDEALERARELLGLVGIDPDRGKEYPHEYSGGMKQRTMIAMSLICNPKLVIADEPTTALDVMVQAQIMELLKRLSDELALSMIMITHNLPVLAENCQKIAIMYAGKIMEYADVAPIFDSPLHPYTQGLLQALPSIKGVSGKLESIPGAPPNLVDPPQGCRFHPRCPYTFDVCRKEEPELLEIEKKRYAACHRLEKGEKS